MFKRYFGLARRGVMGMNRRNIQYIAAYNPRSLFPLVDDKLKTKQLALEHGVTVPDLLGVVTSQRDAHQLQSILPKTEGFCVKPAKGSGGKGILVIPKIEDGIYYRSNGEALSFSNLQRHVSNILAGLFSLGGATDVAMFEACIQVDQGLKSFSFEGVPDIRVIVFRGVPVMAMMRLSCRDSNGKANLHQGAIGVGIDLALGKAINAIQHDRPIQIHPDTQQALLSLTIPHWRDLLALACACADMTGLGYLGVDLVVDEHKGPLLLELNARPGLSIQMANDKGLVPVLKQVERLKRPERWTIGDRVKYAQHELIY